MPRLNPQRMVNMKKRAAEFAGKNVLVPFDEMMHQFYGQQGIKFSQPWMSNAIKEHRGKSYAQLQREARQEFILNNASESNEWIAKQLGVSKRSVRKLMMELKATGKMRASKRYAESKRETERRLPLAYHNSVHLIMRFLIWSPLDIGLSTSDLAWALKISNKTIQFGIAAAKKEGLVKILGKSGQRYFYVPTAKGGIWLGKMQKMRKERDAVLEKTASITSVISRKQKEKERISGAMLFLRGNGLRIDLEKINGFSKEMDRDITRLEKIQQRRQKRK